RDRVCPYCGMQLGPRAVDLRASQFAASFLPSANLTAFIILAVNLALFILELVVNSTIFHSSPGGLSYGVGILLGATDAARIYQQGQWWRLITAGFLHGGFLHIAMNSWSLFILITEVEQFYGTSRLIVAYVFSTFTGFACSVLWSPGRMSLGASAACFGLFGIMLAMGLRQRSDPLVQAVRAHYTQWLILGLLMSLMPGIDMAAHVGGFAGGFLVGLAAGLPGLPNSPRETFWKLMAGLAIAVTLFAFFEDFRSYQAMLFHLRNT
ncbi:MAG: rhomboid family intramembrane serine protease, partial [Acidobacteriaceae bacterium]|nr:rhomboid family intramembrane serine protease [Acidobacteriaceae bacterium]